MQADHWEPNFIDIESEFEKFIETFNGGKLVTQVIEKIPQNVLNADYFFEGDDVIAELKIMSVDASSGENYASRLFLAARHFGYTGSDMMGWAFRGEAIPERVRRRMYSSSYRSIIEAIKKANKQIASTRDLLKRPNAKGLVLLANDKNIGFSFAEMVDVMAKSFNSLKKIEMDCLVYLTPNVFHENPGSDIAYQIWNPMYNVGSEGFSAFVNALGTAWYDHIETGQGKALIREVADDLLEKYIEATPIRELR